MLLHCSCLLWCCCLKLFTFVFEIGKFENGCLVIVFLCVFLFPPLFYSYAQGTVHVYLNLRLFSKSQTLILPLSAFCHLPRALTNYSCSRPLTVLKLTYYNLYIYFLLFFILKYVRKCSRNSILSNCSVIVNVQITLS